MDNKIWAATLRWRAQKLRDAANKCSHNISHLRWAWCKVTVDWESSREITVEEALEYAKRLDYQAALMSAINVAINTPRATGALSCNVFAGVVGKELNIPYFRNPIGDKHHMADNMYDFISGAIQSSASGWVKLDEDEVQDKADEGKFVVGVAHSNKPGPNGKHGHIVIAVPLTLLPQAKPHGRNIPCIIDGPQAAIKPLKSYTPKSIFGHAIHVTETIHEPIWAFYNH